MARYYEEGKYNALQMGGATWYDKRDVEYNINHLHAENNILKSIIQYLNKGCCIRAMKNVKVEIKDASISGLYIDGITSCPGKTKELRDKIKHLHTALECKKSDIAMLKDELNELGDRCDKLKEEKERLKEFCIWMTGCGYDFCQHEYFRKNRDELLKEKGK